MNFSKSDIRAMLAESRKGCRRIRKLSIMWKTVATHRLKELRHLRVVEKLAAWRSNGFDRRDVHNGQWIHSPLPPTPEETTATMWADVNALKKEVLMSEKERSKQGVENFFNELEQETASFTDEELARLERIVLDMRGRAAAHMIVAPTSTAEPFNPRSRCSGMSFDVHVCMGGNTEGRMDPEPGELEPSSVGTGFEAPGQQCL